MIISSYGLTSFKLQSGDTVVAIDPLSKGSGTQAPRFEARVALFTDPAASRDISLSGSPHIFASPGEYEVSDITFTGFETQGTTPFLIEWEGMRILHLGSVGKLALIESALDNFGTVDILFITANNSEAHKIVAQIDPRIIVPMETADAKKGALESFIKEIGEKPERMNKLTIKARGLPTDGQRLVVLGTERE